MRVSRWDMAARLQKAQVLLMTYHLHNFRVRGGVCSHGCGEHIPIVRNDLAFQPIVAAGKIGDYVLQDLWHPSPLGYQCIAHNAYDAILQNRLLR